MVSKHKRLKPVSKRQRRKSIKRSQLRISAKTLAVKRVVSQRGRTHPMEEEVPGITKHRVPQTLLMDSTAIKRFKYYIEQERLRIWFVSGHVYDYYQVPESTVMTLAQAQSKGRYFYYNIRMTFNYRRIR